MTPTQSTQKTTAQPVIDLSGMNEEQLRQIATTVAMNMSICQKEVLTLDEAAQYTGMKKSYLYKLTSSRSIPHYKPTGKNCFFRRKDLENWLTANPVATVTDINTAALTYCMKKNNATTTKK